MFGRKIAGVVLLGLLLLCAGAAAFTIDGHTFAAGEEHTIGNAGSELTYYDIPITLSNATGDSTGATVYTDGLTAADWRDVRFTSSTGSVYPHWIESTTATTAYAWVNVSSIPNGDSALRIYWDSDTAPATSDIDTTFPFGDDFSTVDTDKWTVSGVATVSNGIITVPNGGYLFAKTGFGQGYATRWYARPGTTIYTNYLGVADAADTLADAIHQDKFTCQRVYWSDGGTSAYASSTSIYNNGLHVLELRRYTGHTVFYIDGSLSKDATTLVCTGTRYPAANAASAANYADWVTVRKYSTTEPTHGTYTAINPPVAAFSANVTSGLPPLTVQFADASVFTPTSWAWDFGNDGSTDSTDQNPAHEYADEGTYTVKLTVTNAYGSDDEIKVDYITVAIPYDPPVAAFSANVTSGYAPLTVAFTDSSTGPPTGWHWTVWADGGDSYTCYDQNQMIEILDPGAYHVLLNASNPAGYDEELKEGYITVLAIPGAPVASFTADAIAGHAPLLVSFTDTSTGSPTAWAWDFDGDAVADSTDQNPTYEYAADGNYTVTLQISNAGGTDLESKPEYVSVGALTATYLKASFRFAVVGGSGGGGVTPLTVAFTDTTRTNGTYTRYWSFGDGQTSVEADPTHVYTTAGKYDVRLTVESDTRRSTESYAKVIQAYPVAAASLLPTNTYGAKMTQMMDSNWNLSVIGPLLPTPYTDLVPETLFWGLLWGGVFMIYFVRQGTSWLTALLGIIIGGNVLMFLPPSWAAAGQALLIVSVGAFFYVLIQGRIRSS